MKKSSTRLVLVFSWVLLLCLAFGCQKKAEKTEAQKIAPVVDFGSNKQAGRFIDVNDIKVYYEVYGEGELLLLLHGAFGSIENFIYQIPELSKHFKVIAVDSRAQGRSSDSDKEITYALMASDMSELIDKLNLGSVHVVGWSDGGNIGLELAFAHPEKVKKLVTFGANYTHENWMAAPDSVVMDGNDPMIIKTSTMIKRYKDGIERLSPNIKKKIAANMENYPNFTKEQLKQIKVPVLVVVGDHDAINLDQTIALFTSLPHSQLFIVPSASHFVPVEQPELINSEVIKFLTSPCRDLDRFYWMKPLESALKDIIQM
jgi:pimeloyl-ACP methyl ester carboxylesterase